MIITYFIIATIIGLGVAIMDDQLPEVAVTAGLIWPITLLCMGIGYLVKDKK